MNPVQEAPKISTHAYQIYSDNDNDPPRCVHDRTRGIYFSPCHPCMFKGKKCHILQLFHCSKKYSAFIWVDEEVKLTDLCKLSPVEETEGKEPEAG